MTRRAMPCKTCPGLSSFSRAAFSSQHRRPSAGRRAARESDNHSSRARSDDRPKRTATPLTCPAAAYALRVRRLVLAAAALVAPAAAAGAIVLYHYWPDDPKPSTYSTPESAARSMCDAPNAYRYPVPRDALAQKMYSKFSKEDTARHFHMYWHPAGQQDEVGYAEIQRTRQGTYRVIGCGLAGGSKGSASASR